eukprot:Amastigsp_a175606_17.p1 type:complete len:322 gc:universal Amastigsp_a175606_17:996-31(-)
MLAWSLLAVALAAAALVVRFVGLFPLLYKLYCTRIGYWWFRYSNSGAPAAPHTSPQTVHWSPSFDIHVVPLFGDNYSYLIVNKKTDVAVAIDPADPVVIERTLRSLNVGLEAILTTHKHWDHAAGNAALAAMYPGVRVYGGEAVLALTDALGDRDEFGEIGLRLTSIRGRMHTRGHVVYVASDPLSDAPPAAFTGDTLFVGGCGKFFEGSAADAAATFKTLVAACTPATLVFPGHEYTVANLEFALSVVADHSAVRARLVDARERRARGAATVPSTICDELAHNVFLQCGDESLQRVLGARDEVDALRLLRARKDNAKATT